MKSDNSSFDLLLSLGEGRCWLFGVLTARDFGLLHSCWIAWVQRRQHGLDWIALHIEAETKWPPFPDYIFKWIFLNENVWILIKISLKFVPKGPINNIPALVQIMAWRRSGDKPLSEPMAVSLLTHICVTRPQWVNDDTCSSGHISRPSQVRFSHNCLRYKQIT